ncbi:hypothetical protein CQW34_03186 [Bacteroides fragilis]|uniref:Uncharacterized protein n=1 Tax=Bacteroides fragilis TaxID=817 RepID=A0A2M9V4N9_BACFG|nr:hypothetical protein CQW34_03186 [Bacteroides fragilis]PJY79375.1 hypothetical protein CQW33_03410 [Bacteroides fragilis]
MEGNRVIGKYGEADHAFIADNFDTVFAGRIMGYEAPRTAPYQSVVELETCAQCIFCRIESATVAFIATGFEYAAEHLLQKVDLVWCEVIEVSSSGNIGLYTPGQILSVIVQIARGLCKTDLYVDYIADRTFVHQFLHFHKVRQVTPVVGYKTRDSRLL